MVPLRKAGQFLAAPRRRALRPPRRRAGRVVGRGVTSLRSAVPAAIQPSFESTHGNSIRLHTQLVDSGRPVICSRTRLNCPSMLKHEFVRLGGYPYGQSGCWTRCRLSAGSSHWLSQLRPDWPIPANSRLPTAGPALEIIEEIGTRYFRPAWYEDCCSRGLQAVNRWIYVRIGGVDGRPAARAREGLSPVGAGGTDDEIALARGDDGAWHVFGHPVRRGRYDKVRVRTGERARGHGRSDGHGEQAPPRASTRGGWESATGSGRAVRLLRRLEWPEGSGGAGWSRRLNL